MSKGLDVGTSFVVLAQDAEGGVAYKDFRDAFYIIKPTTPVASKMIEKGLQGKVFVRDPDGAFILLGQDAIEKAIERNESAKRPMYRGVVSAKEKEARRVLAYILKEVAGKAEEPGEKLVFCVPSQPVDQEDEDFDVGYHEDVIKTVLGECGYNARAINEAEALCYSELEADDYTGISLSCLLPGTKIYTDNGIVPVEDVVADDQVITHKGRWRPVIRVISKQFAGVATKIQITGYTNSVEDYRFVDNHELYVKRDGTWQWIGCEELVVGDIVGEPILQQDRAASPVGMTLCERVTNSSAYTKKRIASSASLQRLIGYFLGDGSIGDGGACIQFDFGVDETANIEDVCAIIARVFGKSTSCMPHGDGCTRIKCYSTGLANYFGNHMYTTDGEKCYPWDIARLTQGECLNLLIGLVRSDGEINESGLSFNNTSTRLVVLAKQLFSRIGIAATVSYRAPRTNFSGPDGRVITGKKTAWIVAAAGKRVQQSVLDVFTTTDITNDKEAPRLFIEDGFCCGRVQAIEHEEYSGPVYDLQVAEDHSFSGPQLTIHNCGAGMVNCCVMLNGEPVVTLATTRSGDWLDRMTAIATGEPDSVVQAEKEHGEFIIGKPANNPILDVLSSYYVRLIDYTTKQLTAAMLDHKSLPKFKTPIPVVIAGGTSQAKGFVPLFHQQLISNGFPLPIKEVRHAKDPLHAVARGCLVAAKVL